MSQTSTDASVQRFNEIAAEWDEKPGRVAMARNVGASILDEIPVDESMEALEYGCGTGLITLMVAPHLRHVVAADNASGMLGALREKLRSSGVPNVDPRQLDLSSEAWDGGRLDLIFSSMTMHHIEDVPALLRTFHDMLRPGGYIALADLDAEDGSFHGGDVPGVRHHGFDRARFGRWLEGAGFEAPHAVTAHRLTKETEDGSEREFTVFLITARRPETGL